MIAAALATLLVAQTIEQRGFVEMRALAYPQAAKGDSGRLVGDALLRWEADVNATPWLRVSAAFDARTDTHRQVARDFSIDTDGRNLQRPAFSLRRLSATLHRGKFTAEFGRQFIRWGKADILNPTDRFSPKDYLSSVVDTDFLGVQAARITYESGADSIDVVWQPRFTPSRTPLLKQRWTVLPTDLAGVQLRDDGARYPGGSQYGIRWNHVTSAYEYSLSYFEGRQNLPSFDGTLLQAFPPAAAIARTYPRLRMVGADAAVPLPWFTVKAEAAHFGSATPDAQEYVLYVAQIERFVREWSFVGGYAGSVTTRPAMYPYQFAADRGVAKSFVGRAGLTIDANRSMAIEAAIRARGSFLRYEYAHAVGQHWRTTLGAAWIRGNMDDFLGQYRRNSYASVAIRYSF
jgi:hypothetical protein